MRTNWANRMSDPAYVKALRRAQKREEFLSIVEGVLTSPKALRTIAKHRRQDWTPLEVAHALLDAIETELAARTPEEKDRNE